MPEIRLLEETDYIRLREHINSWTDGVNVLPLFPRHVFRHFRDTQFLAVSNDAPCGVISGFFSPAFDDEAYVRIIAIAPEMRGSGLGKALYEQFLATARAAGRRCVRAITSPDNHRSIAFHQALGFTLEPGDMFIGEIPVMRDYAAPGEHRVLMVNRLHG